MQISRIQLSDKAGLITVSHATVNVGWLTPVWHRIRDVQTHNSGVVGLRQSPGFRSLPSMGLERRPLPSTAVTRLPRYYEPHRHPRWPGLSVTGVRLGVTRPLSLGVSRVALDLRVQACRRHYPGGPLGRIARETAYSSRLHGSPAAAAFPTFVQGRRTHWSFRGLIADTDRIAASSPGSWLPGKRTLQLPASNEAVTNTVTFDDSSSRPDGGASDGPGFGDITHHQPRGPASPRRSFRSRSPCQLSPRGLLLGTTPSYPTWIPASPLLRAARGPRCQTRARDRRSRP